MSSAPPPHTRTYWLLQTQPGNQELSALQNGHTHEEWITLDSEVMRDDRVFLWRRGEEEIYARGRILDKEQKVFNPEFSVHQDRVKVQVADRLDSENTVRREQLESILTLGSRGNAFEDRWQPIKLSAEQVVALNKMIQEKMNVEPNPPAEATPEIGTPSQNQEVEVHPPAEDAEARFRERLVNASTISRMSERTETMFNLATETAQKGLLEHAGVAFAFALTASSQIEETDLRQKWRDRIRKTAADYKVHLKEDESEEEMVPDHTSRLTLLDADVYTDKDLLGIENDVEAFAKLIAARSIEPPLSIGLFGDWGSGKTFFMRHLRKRVEEIAKSADVSGIAQKDMAFYKRIVQIEFNAWHYSESNLWASMVEHIFQNLRISESDKPSELEIRRNAILEKIEIENIALAQAKEQENKAKENLRKKESELKEVENRQRAELEKLEELSVKDVLASAKASIQLDPKVQALITDTLRATGIEGVGDSISELQASLAAARSVMNRGSSLFLPLFRATDRRQRIIMLLLVLLAAPTLGLLIELILRKLGAEGVSRMYAFFSGLATFISVGAYWLHKQVQWVSMWLGRIENAKELVDKQIEEQIITVKAAHEKEIALHKQQLDVLTAKYGSLRNEREEAQRKVEHIQEELRQTTPVQWLAKFIQDRASSDDYRKHLGLLALIRRDFEKLSNLLDEDNKELMGWDWQEEQKDKANRINRIVLYIDDLDRCQPSQVVAVLQAVHLLLAFKLFIVVVGVDCRWVTQSLRKHYPELLRDNPTAKGRFVETEKAPEPNAADFQMATSRDYLEKIFQIPFWLSPMTPASTVSLLKGMLESSVVKDATASTPAPQLVRSEVQDEQHTHLGIEDASEIETGNIDTGTPQPLAAQGSQAASKPVNLAKFDLNPKSLDLRDREFTFMQALAPVLGRSPRSVKRFINIYRLIKVSLAPDKQVEFLRKRSPVSQYQAVMFLLVIETGLPAISAEIFSILQSDYKVVNPDSSFNGLLNHLFGRDANKQEEVRRLQEWFRTGGYEEFATLDLDHFANWVPLISRYSFNTERSWI